MAEVPRLAAMTVVLVHGGFVDGSGWEGVYQILKDGRLPCQHRPESDDIAGRRCRRNQAHCCAHRTAP